jgi:hypothetical protein
LITHIVTFKMKDGSPEHIARCVEMVEGMRGKVASLRSLEVGVNIVDTPQSHHFCLVATFDDLAGLQAYQDDPVHLEVATYLRAERETSAAVDFER